MLYIRSIDVPNQNEYSELLRKIVKKFFFMIYFIGQSNFTKLCYNTVFQMNSNRTRKSHLG